MIGSFVFLVLIWLLVREIVRVFSGFVEVLVLIFGRVWVFDRFDRFSDVEFLF